MEALGTGLLTTTVGLLGKSGLSAGANGLAVASVLLPLIYAGARVSGANYNPMVSFALVLLGKMTPSQGMSYVISQLLGAVGGGFLAKALISPAGVIDPSFELTPASGLPDVLFSFALVLTVLQTAVSKAQSRNSFFGLAISSVVAVGVALGANMNPGVSVGLFAAAGHTTKGLLARLALPLLAAIPATLLFRATDIDETYAMKKGMLPMVSADFVRNRGPYLMELVGTFLLTGTVGLALATKGLPAPVAAGLCLTFLAFGSGYVSGAHVNPAVTLGVYLRNAGFGIQKLAGYAGMQTLGAIAAGAVVKSALGAGAVTGNFPVPQAGFSCAQAFGVEALFTGLLVSTVLHMGAATGYQGNQLNGLAVSLSLGVGLMASGMISGGGLNPAAVTGLALSNGGASGKQLQQMWIYLVAPLVGAVLGHASVKLTSPIDMGKE